MRRSVELLPLICRIATGKIAAFAAIFLCCSVANADDGRPTLAAAPRIAASTGSEADAPSLTETETSQREREIEELIRQLGNSRYAVRRAAANQLRQIGPEAFDALHAATGDADPEIAASARYLLRQITVRWVQSSDVPAVRALLRDYDGKPEEARSGRVQELARLPGGAGLAGLCRIARFDRSPLVSRTAALAIIRPPDRRAASTTIDADLVERELGRSTREPVVWLRRYLEQLRDPGASAEFWEKLVANESARLEQNSADTSPRIVLDLMWNLAEVHRQVDNGPAMLGVLDRMIDLSTDDLQAIGIELINWLLEAKAWSPLDEFLKQHQADFQDNKRLLYHVALARDAQGRTELADELAEKASRIDPQGTLEGFITAKDMEEHRKFEWAVREYHRAIDDQPIASHEAILARVYLSALQNDYDHNREAADVLEPLVKAVQNEGKTGQLYTELLRYYRGRLSLPEADGLAAKYHFYRAGQYRAEQDWQREREALELAINFDPTDADVLIAMYRLPEQDAAWHAAVRRRIEELSRQFQQEIDQNPTDPTPYNQWAWLVSNTEGDFQKAIRYSHRSLELITPGSGPSAGASFLDTLGRCYFAAGDLENAVKYQRQAIEKIDYMQVMHRQLALFEQALAERGEGPKTKREVIDSESSL